MIHSPEPRELEPFQIRVVSGTGSKIINITGYLDLLIVDVPGNETFKISIKGKQGIEYYISPTAYTGDSTILFDPRVPMSGKMTITLFQVSVDGLFAITPVGDIKKS